MTNVGSNAAKLEEQLRSLTQDLQRLTAGLESDEVASPATTSGSTSQVKRLNMGATVEADSAVEGVYITSGNLQVDGLIKGEIVCRGTLVISEHGVVQGNVEASEIFLAGRLEGEVECQGSFVVLPTGWLSGKVSAAEVSIQDGAFYAGELRLQNQRAQEASPRSMILLDLLERRKESGLSLADLRSPSSGATPDTTFGSSVASPSTTSSGSSLSTSLFRPASESSWNNENEDAKEEVPDVGDETDQDDEKSSERTLESTKIGGLS
jgi:cytoskeletal protein CcmA (bactofilin family)